MKQVIMEPRHGSIGVVDLPEPALRPGMLLVRNAFSVISPGTERNAVKLCRDSLLATARARPALGERVSVIGLGVLGLLTVQLLRAAGVRVIAFDLSPDLARRARDLGAEASGAGETDDQVAAALAWTDGVGVDGVIVTAASASDAPMVAAAGMCRERGRVTAVGLVPFGLPRDIAYHKELELTIARSYGPGRYDPAFEEKGLDYPIEYVRWTETRNLEAFLQLVKEGKVDPLPLVTHRFGIEEAP